MGLHLDYSVNRQQDHFKRYKRNISHPGIITANICKVIKDPFQLYFKYIYLEVFRKKKSHQLKEVYQIGIINKEFTLK